MAISVQRIQGQVRPTSIVDHPTGAAGSVLITQGRTQVLCTASVAQDVPAWLIDRETGRASRGWVTAEYAMLPGSTPQRKKRGLDSRGTEIQRLIGRALRAAVDLTLMPGVAITCDCDVLVADGGTRTTSITGAFVALAQAIASSQAKGIIADQPILGPLAAVSVGIIDGEPWLDLDYALDVRADVDMNVAMNHLGQFVEIQATGEGGTLSRSQLETLLDLATTGIEQLMEVQQSAL